MLHVVIRLSVGPISVPGLFTREELEVLDHLTAAGEVVLVSLGGRPEMPEVRLARVKREKEDVEKRVAKVDRGLHDKAGDARREPVPSAGHGEKDYTGHRDSETGSEGLMRLRRGGP